MPNESMDDVKYAAIARINYRSVSKSKVKTIPINDTITSVKTNHANFLFRYISLQSLKLHRHKSKDNMSW